MGVTRRVFLQVAPSALAASAVPSGLKHAFAEPDLPAGSTSGYRDFARAIGYSPLPSIDSTHAVWNASIMAFDPAFASARTARITVRGHLGHDLSAGGRIVIGLHQHTSLPDGREISWSPWCYESGNFGTGSVSADCRYTVALESARCRTTLTLGERSDPMSAERIQGRCWDFAVGGASECLALRPGIYFIPLVDSGDAGRDWGELESRKGSLQDAEGAEVPFSYIALTVESLLV